MHEHASETRDKLYARMEDLSIAILFSGRAPHKSLDQFYTYAPQRNFFYLTNLNEPNMILMMMKGKEENKTYLFIEENTDTIIKWEGARMEKEAAAEHTGIPIENIRFLSDFKKMFNQAMNYARSLMGTPPKFLYLDLYHVSENEKPMALTQADFIIENYKELPVKAINEHLAYLRMFKTETELTHIKKAIAITQKGLERIMANLPTRRYEYQLPADFIHEITLEGSEGHAFDIIAAGGKNATVLHYIDNSEPVYEGDLILFDLGALYKNYAADISRTYPVNGRFTKRQRELYDIVLEVNKKTIEQVKPGVTWKTLNAFAKDLLAERAVDAGVIETPEDITSVYYHSIGHFLGLDVHDVGLYDMPLEAGMVLTIEPGLYVKEENIGIRIEDNILVTKEGCENLSASITKDPNTLESIIQKAQKKSS